jgi:hypothetical protein
MDLLLHLIEPQDKDLAVGGWDVILEQLSEHSDEDTFRPDEDSFRSSDFGKTVVKTKSGNMHTMIEKDNIRYFTTQNLPHWSEILEESLEECSSSGSDESHGESAGDSDESVYQEEWLLNGGFHRIGEVFWEEILAEFSDVESGSGDEDEVSSL